MLGEKPGIKVGLAEGVNGGGNSSIIYGRVVDVITDAFHPKYKEYGESNAINGVLFVTLGAGSTEDTEQSLKLAFDGQPDVKKAPLKGEIVRIETKPYWSRDGSSTATKAYWTEIVPLWNHPHHNAYPDIKQFGDGPNDFGDNFEEVDTVNPIQPFPGDVILEGRHANSIRMGGTKHPENPLVDDSNNGKPYNIIRIGQTDDVEAGYETVTEDINKDIGSIYMMSDHEIPIEVANEKRDSYKEEPEKPDKFKGEQIMINTNRMFINAKEDSILMSAGTSIGGNAKTINFDGDVMVSMDAKKIYLGKKALKNEDEPVLKGQTSIEWMEVHLALFETLINTMQKMPPVPAAAVAVMKAAASAIKPQIPSHKKRLKTLLSKKVFTE